MARSVKDIPRKRAYAKRDLKSLPPEPKHEKVPMPDVEHAIIDGDSAIYAIAWGPKTKAEMARLYDAYVMEIMESLDTPAATVYVKGSNNFRYQVQPNYKMGRKERKIDPGYEKRIALLYEHAQESYVMSDNAEADDYCCAHYNELVEQDKVVVLSHIDKDLNMIPGYHWSPAKKKLSLIRPEMAYGFLMRQIMMGDAGDSIPGIPGIGPKKALEELHHKFPVEFWPAVQLKFQKELGPKWKDTLLETANLIYIRQRYEDFRPLDWDEIDARMKWAGPDDGPVFLAQMDLEAIALDMDHVAYNKDKKQHWWGAVKTDVQPVPKASAARKRLQQTLTVLGADKLPPVDPNLKGTARPHKKAVIE